MADSPSTIEGGPSVEAEFETTVLQMPHDGLRAAVDDSRGGKKETQREARRKAWQASKIQDSRTKKRPDQETKLVEQHALEVFRSPASEPQGVASIAHKRHASGGTVHLPHNRTQNEWKVICELKLCAGCLTRTIPPHKPGDKRAPCKDRPSASYDAKLIRLIRRKLKQDANEVRRQAVPGHNIAKHMQRNQPNQPLCAPSTISHRDSSHGIALSVGYCESDNSPCGLRSSDRHVPAPFAPIYNLQDPGSYDQSGIRAALYRQFGPALSQSSATHVDSSTGLASAEQFQHARDKPHPMTLLGRPADLNIDMMGMTPTTPSPTDLPTLHFEDELGPVNQGLQHAANISFSESSGRAPRFDVEDWDSKTKVSEDIQVSELELALSGCLTASSSSRAVVEMLMREKLDNAEYAAERSNTTPGIYCSIDRKGPYGAAPSAHFVFQNQGHSWYDGATLTISPHV
ncbi:hypothetical protein BDU57DRAFT_532296 [Ampelomyces quisqualis]|uniref:Uncharacterized protein n=1 Tax=Ampelomyces quisqualis TaxID=50730 RepID=A0A6A5QFC3_AMPQU|nr:hypothetical protein BDU57DRAFT_532296 [Ampelomyces quisqualis]